MTRAAVAFVLWLPMAIAACCHPTRVSVPVVVTPPPCLTEPAPRPPATEDDAAWSAYHVRLEAWAALAERSCYRPRPAPARPDPGPAWWTKQPSGAVGE